MTNKSDPFAVGRQSIPRPRTVTKILRLTESELVSPLWRKLVETYTARLQQLREKNDIDTDEKATAATRAEIRMVRSFLDLDVKKPIPDTHEQDGQ